MAQGCSCNRSVPHSGTYTIAYNEKLNMPRDSKVKIEAFDVGAELGARLVVSVGPIQAELFCNGKGGYEGKLNHMDQYMWLLPVESGTRPGVGLSREFFGIVRRPAGFKWESILEESEARIHMTLEGFEGQATLGMCESVAANIEAFETLLAVHEDEDILNQAVNAGMGAFSTVKPMRLNSNDEKVIPANDTTTYQDLLQEEYLKRSNTMVGATTAAMTMGDGLNWVGASTDPASCDITEPEPTHNGRCRMSVLLEAMMEHERVHEESCNDLKQKGQASEYRFWINHPEALALDEIAAYKHTGEVLRKWYSANCS